MNFFIKAINILALMLLGIEVAVAANARIEIFKGPQKLKSYDAPLVDMGKFLRLTVGAKDLSNADIVRIGADFVTSAQGQSGYIVLGSGKLCAFDKKGDVLYVDEESMLPIAGIKKTSEAYLGIVNGMRLAAKPAVEIKGGKYKLLHVFDLKATPLYEDIVIDYWPLKGKEANYSGMGRLYRNFKFEKTPDMRPIAKSVKAKKAAACALLAIKCGGKNSAATLEGIGKLIETLKGRGTTNVCICIDGADELLARGDGASAKAAEEKISALVASAKASGFEIAASINPSKIEKSDKTSEKLLARDERGNPIIDPNTKRQLVCPKAYYQQKAVGDLNRLRDLGFSFVLVDGLCTRPPACFDKDHLADAEVNALYCKRIMKLAGQVMGSGGCSEAPDFIAEYTDFTLESGPDIFADKDAVTDKLVPLWQIVYHGIILSNPSKQTFNYPVKGEKVAAKAMEFGARPLVVIGGPDSDLSLSDGKKIQQAADAVAKAASDAKTFAALQTKFLQQHQEITPDIFRCVYSDGTEIVFNYGKLSYIHNGKNIKPNSYVIFKPKSWLWNIF